MARSFCAQGQRIRVAVFGVIVGSSSCAQSRTVRNPSPCEHLYCSDFGSERFLGDFLSSSDTSSAAQAGFFTFPPRMMSLALNFCPYNFSLALPSERRVEPSSETPANNPLLRE